MPGVILHGDMRDVLPSLGREWVDAIVCDPPYGLSKQPKIEDLLTDWLAERDHVVSGGGFMSKKWDSIVPGPSYWRVCYDALKPGGHLLAFGGTRTYDLLVIALRMAGFEIRDTICWLYSQGFPKGRDMMRNDILPSIEEQLRAQGVEGEITWR